MKARERGDNIAGVREKIHFLSENKIYSRQTNFKALEKRIDFF